MGPEVIILMILKEAIASKAAEMLVRQLLKMAKKSPALKNMIDSVTHVQEKLFNSKIGEELKSKFTKEINEALAKDPQQAGPERKDRDKFALQHTLLLCFAQMYLNTLQDLHAERNPGEPPLKFSDEKINQLADELEKWISGPKDKNNLIELQLNSNIELKELKRLTSTLGDNPSAEQVNKVFATVGNIAQKAAGSVFKQMPAPKMIQEKDDNFRPDSKLRNPFAG